MEEMYGKFYAAMSRFRKLKLSELFVDMTRADCMTLMAIDHFSQQKQLGILTVSELADKMHVKPSAVSRTLKSLEDKELIERTVNKADRRNTYVQLTEQGRCKWKTLEKTMSDLTTAVLSRMKEEDLKMLISCLEELYQVAQEEIDLRINHNGKEQ